MGIAMAHGTTNRTPSGREFSREDFHPWDMDNRDLLAHWAAKFA